MSISPNRDPQWTDDLEALFFGIYEPRKRTARRTPSATPTRRAKARRRRPATTPTRRTRRADEKVDLVLWHWKDPRLQTQQEVQEARDRTFSYLAEYRVQPKKFIRLADDDMRTVTWRRSSGWRSAPTTASTS